MECGTPRSERGPRHRPESLWLLIVDHSHDRWWRFKTWRSIELDGFLYWIIEDGTVINRRPAD